MIGKFKQQIFKVTGANITKTLEPKRPYRAVLIARVMIENISPEGYYLESLRIAGSHGGTDAHFVEDYSFDNFAIDKGNRTFILLTIHGEKLGVPDPDCIEFLSANNNSPIRTVARRPPIGERRESLSYWDLSERNPDTSFQTVLQL
jgi:hypothetical protein